MIIQKEGVKMEHIKITYEDGEVWRAKWKTENDCYESEDVVTVCDPSGCRNELGASETLYVPLNELLDDKELKVEEITESEYLFYIQSRLLESIKIKVEEYKEKLRELQMRESGIMDYMDTLRNNIS